MDELVRKKQNTVFACFNQLRDSGGLRLHWRDDELNHFVR